MKDERYVWDAEFHMKSGNSFKTKYVSKFAVSSEVFDEIFKMVTQARTVWLSMNTEISTAAISINLSEVEAVTLVTEEG